MFARIYFGVALVKIIGNKAISQFNSTENELQ